MGWKTLYFIADLGGKSIFVVVQIILLSFGLPFWVQNWMSPLE